MRIFRFLFFLFFLFGFPLSFFASAQSTVALSPQRIILEGRERTETLRIINPGNEVVHYRIQPIILKQDPSGKIEKVENTEEYKDILRMVRFSPRKIRLNPREMQTVRILVRKPADLEPGEYRLHISVSPIPKLESPDEQEIPKEPPSGISVSMNFSVGVSIPLIIRHGETHVDLGAKDLQVESLPDGKEALKVRLLATGNRSVYLDASLFHGDTLLGKKQGFAVYQPNGQRDLIFPLQDGPPPSGSALRLVLHDREKDGKTPLLKEIPLLMP